MIITGTIRDDAGRPVVSARAFIIDAPGPFPDVAALTTDDGTFQLSVGIAGRYRPACHADGFVPAVVDVAVENSAAPSAVDVTLLPRAG